MDDMIRTNYQKGDWQKFIPSISLRFFLMGGIMFVCCFWFVIPGVILIGEIAESLNRNPEILQKWVDNHYPTDDNKVELLNMFLIGFFMAPLMIALPISFLIRYSDDLGIYISKKLHIHPPMALCLIRKGKIIMRISCD